MKRMNPELTITTLRIPSEFRAHWNKHVPHGKLQDFIRQAVLEWLEVAEDRGYLHESELFAFPCESTSTLARLPREIHSRIREVAHRCGVSIPLVYLAAMKTLVDNIEGK